MGVNKMIQKDVYNYKRKVKELMKLEKEFPHSKKFIRFWYWMLRSCKRVNVAPYCPVLYHNYVYGEKETNLLIEHEHIGDKESLYVEFNRIVTKVYSDDQKWTDMDDYLLEKTGELYTML